MDVSLDSSYIKTQSIVSEVVNEVAMYRLDVVHRRELISSSKTKRGGPRGKPKGYSRNSVRRFVRFFRNIDPLDYWLTLTYPATFPKQIAVINAHKAKVCRWLTAKGISYVVATEFQKRGAAHFHFVLNAKPDREALVRYWGKLASASKPAEADTCVYLEPVQSWDATVHYFTKFKPYQRAVPAIIEGELGRWWGHSQDIKAEPRQVLRDDDDDDDGQALAVARFARKLNKHKHPNARRDNGLHSYTTRDTAAATLDYVARLTEGGSKARGREAKPHGDD